MTSEINESSALIMLLLLDTVTFTSYLSIDVISGSVTIPFFVFAKQKGKA